MKNTSTVSSSALDKSKQTSSKSLFRSTLAGTLGTALEYYDFVLYGLAAAIVFNRLFFPDVSPAIGLLASFATYAVGFAARPIGGLVLGAIGDRIGRKQVLVITIVLMGISSFAIGLLPTYEQIGMWAPALLVLLRVAQGFGAGAELASASTLLVESAPPVRRGLFGALLCLGTNAGTLLASAVWLMVSSLPDEALFTWGWRLPFLASILIAAWGLWTRRHVNESETFKAVAGRQASLSIKEIYGGLFTGGKKALIICFGLRIGEGGTSIVYQVFLVGYIATLPGMSRSTGTMALMIASIVAFVTIPIIGHLTDKVGRRTVYRVLAGLQVLFAFPGVMMINSGNFGLIVTAFVIAFTIAVLGMYAVESSWMAEMFGSRHRLAGITAAKELGGLLGAGIAPFVCAALSAAIGHWWPIATYIAVLAAVSLTASIFAPETRGRDLVSANDAI